MLGRQRNVQKMVKSIPHGAKTSGKKEVSHSFSIPAFPIMLIVTELGFLASRAEAFDTL